MKLSSQLRIIFDDTPSLPITFEFDVSFKASCSSLKFILIAE